MNGDRTTSNEIPPSKLNDDLAKLEILKKQSLERNQYETQLEQLKAQIEKTHQQIEEKQQQQQQQQNSLDDEDTLWNRISNASSNIIFYMSVWACLQSSFEWFLKGKTEKYSEFSNKLVNIVHACVTSALSLDLIYRRKIWDKDLINPFPKVIRI